MIFDRRPLYKLAFEGKKATHILYVYALARAIDEWRIELKKKSGASTLIAIEEQQLTLLRNLKFKYFLIAVVGLCLETLLGHKVDLETVGFDSETAASKNNTVLSLAALWSPVVQAILSFVATNLSLDEFSRCASEDTLADEIAKKVSAQLYVTKIGASFSVFVNAVR